MKMSKQKFLEKILTFRAHLAAIRRDRRGTAMLEMTIMTPVLLTIGLGVMEFGNLIFKRHMIENGIRDAGRYISGMTGACNTVTLDPTIGAAAVNIANYGNIAGTGPLRVNGWQLNIAQVKCVAIPATYNSVSLRGNGIGGVGQLLVIEIDTTVNYGDIDLGFLGVLNRLGVGYSTLSFPVKHEERYFGTR